MKIEPKPSDREVLAGVVERVTYQNAETEKRDELAPPHVRFPSALDLPHTQPAIKWPASLMGGPELF
jgi:hypothetical protein